MYWKIYTKGFDSLKYDLKMSILKSNKKNSLKYQMISIVMHIPWKSFKYNKFSKLRFILYFPSVIIRNHSDI